MQRRDFLGFLAQASVLPTAAWVTAPDRVSVLPQQRFPVLYTPVAGTRYYQSSPFVQALLPGTAVTLLREPLNRHDTNAVALFTAADKIGYIPRRCNRAVAELLDAGQSLHAALEPSFHDPDDWHGPLQLAVWMQTLAPPLSATATNMTS